MHSYLEACDLSSPSLTTRVTFLVRILLKALDVFFGVSFLHSHVNKLAGQWKWHMVLSTVDSKLDENRYKQKI